MGEHQGRKVFISHASADDGFVKELREQLEAYQIPVWADSRELSGGDELPSKIVEAIENAPQFMAVLSPNAVNSSWVRREIKKALKVQKDRKDDGYRVIPLLLPGIKVGALGLWFGIEPVAISVEVGPGGLSEALPKIFEALGKQLPTDHEPAKQAEAKPVEELVLTLSDPKVETQEGKRRAAATATLTYEPGDSAARPVTSKRFTFTAPLGPIEADDLRWYLESYFLWPVGVFETRAKGIEQKLPQWGQDLFKAALGAEAARGALTAWQNTAGGAERRFSVHVDSDLPEGASAEAQAAAREAATELFALPWELLHDGRDWLFQGRCPARVRRRLPNRQAQTARPTALPIRILLVSPRPEKDSKGNPVGYIDHRISARPLVEAAESLGELVRLTILTPPTYAALDQALQAAAGRHEPFDVVHFDGHGVYDRRLGLGGLCFEDPKDADALGKRTMEFIDAVKLAGLFRQHRVPLVFLEACQTAVAEADPTHSVAARLLEEGVTSVVAMSCSVLVETARRFVQAFYKSLAEGTRVGQAMLAGQRTLFADTWRGKVMGAGDLQLQDWFVPVIYQEKQDPLLVTKVPAREVRQLQAKRRRLSLGALPEEPMHGFRGRSRELLALERLLHGQPWAVVRGTGGSGKTTLAVELARWLTRTARFERAAFVSLEHHRDARALLDILGHQLLPEGDKYSVAQFESFDKALQPVERALRDHPTVIVLDNCESVLNAGDALTSLVHLWKHLGEADPRTRLVFTTREPLPAPFNHKGRERELGALDRADAIELVSEVMKQNSWTPPAADPGGTPQEIADLVEAVNCHARALVLLAREVAQRGVKATTENLRTLMADLERKHPGDRENSLYASVELSLHRLKLENRKLISVLAVCQGGVHLAILGILTGLEPDAARQLAIELIGVGLGEDMGYGHLRLDPGLPPYLVGQMKPEELDALRSRWAEAMAQLTGYLYKEQFKNAQLAAHLTLLELPNLMAMLEWLQDRWPPERVVGLANGVEGLVANLGQAQALALATRVREQAARKLGDWSHARYTTEDSNFDRLLERGDLQGAHAAARQLLQRCLAAGESAYPQAPYDLAMAFFNVGRALCRAGDAEGALEPLAEAQHRFQSLADTGDASAERMVIGTITETADCLTALGRLDDAATAQEDAISRSQAKGNVGDVAQIRFQLGTVRLRQRRYREALKIYAEVRDTFEALGEPTHVGAVWHQIGMVHEKAGQSEPAEQAYRQSLAIEVRENNLAGQASSLGQLGSLYGRMGRWEEAVTFHRQAAAVDVRLGDLKGEGEDRSNLAIALIGLRRHDEARRELQRAIECQEPFGHAAEPWKTWAILDDLERATGHGEAGQAARRQAIQTYLAYRRAGGVSQSPRVRLFDLVTQAIQKNAMAEAHQLLSQFASDPQAPPFVKALVGKLQSLLGGDRNPGLADDPELQFVDAAELQLLLESLSAH